MRSVPCLAVALALAGLAQSAQAAPSPCRGFDGVWTTNYGVMRFRTSGATAVGDYYWAGTGAVTGRLAGGALTGRWKDGSGEGTISLRLAPRGQAFTGTWTRSSGAGNPGGVWNGTCGGVLPPAATARPAPGPAAPATRPAPTPGFKDAMR